MKKVKITTDVTEPFEAKLLSKNPKTAGAFWSLLPIHAKARLWYEELYFKIPVNVKAENQQKILRSGDIAFWPGGREVSIFLGSNEETNVVDKLNVFGRILGNPDLLKSDVTQGRPILIHIEKIGR